MPANTGLHNTAAFYLLLGDGRGLGSIKNPNFRTATSVAFQIPSSMVQLFSDSLSRRKGRLPFQNVSLVILNYSFEEILRYSWSQTTVTQIDFPALNATASVPLVFSVNLSVLANPQPSSDTHSASSAYLGGSRDRTILSSIFRLRIDGLETACASVSEIGAFSIGRGGSGDLFIAIVHEGLADPFRSWLQSGNTMKSGSLEYLFADLNLAFKINFTGLRIRTIDPALTTASPRPAKIHLSYTGIGVGA